MSTSEEKLLEAIRERCYPPQAKGEEDMWYLDLSNVSLYPFGLNLIGSCLYTHIRQLEIDAVGGPAFGAVPLILATASRYTVSKKRPVECFYVRNYPEGDLIEFGVVGKLQHGSKVVLLDDLATDGKPLLNAIQLVQKYHKCTVLKIVTLVDRLQGAAEQFNKEGIPFESVFTIKDLRTQV